jgi:cysteine synthase
MAAGLAAVALAAPAAVAQPTDNTQSPTVHKATTDAPVVRTIDEGIDWGSAAMGAGGAGAAFILVTLGGVALASRHRSRVAR